MRRDKELIKRILETIADAETVPESLEGYEDAQVSYHVHLCAEAGFIHQTSPGMVTMMIPNLTWSGHDALDALQVDPSL